MTKILSLVLVCLSALFLESLITSDDDRNNSDHFIEYQVVEELPPNHFVGNLVVDFGLDIKYSSSLLQQLRFHSLTKNRNANSSSVDSVFALFQVHKERGIVTTGTVIDREILCPKSPSKCYVRLDVAVQPAKFFQILKVQIEIADVNDNSPVFPCAAFLHKISESSDEGSSFLLPTATDDDSGRFSVQNYDIIPSRGTPFELKRRQSWNDAGIDEVRVVLKEKLDREKQDNYEFVVVASDGGQPCKSGHLNVKVLVLDANDNKPQFDKNMYELWVEENTPSGTVLLELHAEDRDEGLNGQVSYNLSFNSFQEFGSLIGIGEESGQLYLKEDVDYEKGYSTISLSVVAHDKGNDPLQSFASVLVHIQDVNDNQPIVTVTTLTPSGYAEVSEDVEVGTFVAHLSVVDYDMGPCGRAACEALNEYFEVVRLYKSEFKLVTTRELKDMPPGSNSVSVSCSDCGIPQLTTVVNINILLRKSDDDGVEERSFDVSLEENFLSPNPLLVLRTSRSDRLSFRFIDGGTCAEFLSLNRTTGEIRHLRTFDHETTPMLICKVSIESGSDPAEVVPIRVNVVDRNDEKPRFEKDTFVFHIHTNQPSGQLVGKVRAQDKDSPPYNSFYFNFIDGNGLESYLYLEKWTGLLRTASVLKEPRYLKAGVGVFEVDSTEQASAAEVIVHVLHPGDNNLFYLFRSSPIYRVHPDRANIRVGDTWSPEAVLVKMGMYDGNSTFNQTFAIASGNEEGYFSLDGVSGVLRLLKRLGACKHYTLNLTASRGHDSAWMIFNVSSDNKWCRLSDDNPNWSSVSRFLHSDDDDEFWRDPHPLASEQLSVVLSGVLVVIIVFVILGLFFLLETNKKKQASSPSSSL